VLAELGCLPEIVFAAGAEWIVYHDLREMRHSVQFDLPLRARNDLLLQQALLRGLGGWVGTPDWKQPA